MTVGLSKGPVEKRQHNRYCLAATVSFSWETDDHRILQGQGRTRDCSTTGAFIVTQDKVSVGSVLQLDFSLPSLLAAGLGSKLRTRGRVIRTEYQGFAVLTKLSPGSLCQREEAVSPVRIAD
jgi:hypothetical protein